MNYTKQNKKLFEEEESSGLKDVATKFMQGVATSSLSGMAGKAVASQIGSASKELYSPKASSSTKAASSADKASSGMSTPLSPTKTNSSVGSASQSSASGSLGSLYKNSVTASKSKQTSSERLKEAFSSTKPNPYTPQSSEKYKSSSEIVKKTKNKFDIDPTLNQIKASYDKAKKASGYEQKSRIQSLQNSLNKYGVRDSEENTLKEDGIYGEKTRSAFESLYEKPTAAKNAKYDMKLKELRRQGEKVSSEHKPYKASHQQGLDFVYDVVNLQKNLNKAGIYDDEANTLEVDGIFGDRTKSALTRLSTTKAEDLYPINRITNHNRELISRALDISSRITGTLYPSIPLGLVQRQLNEAGFRDVNGELLVEDGIFGEQMEGALRWYGEEIGDGSDFSAVETVSSLVEKATTQNQTTESKASQALEKIKGNENISLSQDYILNFFDDNLLSEIDNMLILNNYVSNLYNKDSLSPYAINMRNVAKAHASEIYEKIEGEYQKLSNTTADSIKDSISQRYIAPSEATEARQKELNTLSELSTQALALDEISDFRQLKLMQDILSDGANINTIRENINSGGYEKLNSSPEELNKLLDDNLSRITDIPHANPVENMSTLGDWGYLNPQYAQTFGYQHTGVDFAINNEVYAVVGGVVVAPINNIAAGKNVVVIDANGLYHSYAHLRENHVNPGDIILPGEELGIAGNTGNSKGIHLHYEVQSAHQEWGNPATSLPPTDFFR